MSGAYNEENQAPKVWELNTVAAALKRKGDIQGAIKYAGEAFEIMKKVGGFGAGAWTKFPLYLQAGGRFDESMKAFDWIIENTELLASSAPEMDGQPPFVIRWQASMLAATVHDKARLACVREGRSDLARRHANLSQACRAESDAQRKVVDLHRERQREKSRNRLKKLKSGELSFDQFDRLARLNK